MSKYQILDSRYGITEGGMACGPVPGNVIAEVKVRDTETGEEKYFVDEEAFGTVNICMTTESIFDKLMSQPEDDDFWDWLNNEALVLSYSDYGDFYSELGDSEQDKLYRYLIYIVRAEEENLEEFMEAQKGKYIDEITIPKTDVEEEMEELEEEY